MGDRIPIPQQTYANLSNNFGSSRDYLCNFKGVAMFGVKRATRPVFSMVAAVMIAQAPLAIAQDVQADSSPVLDPQTTNMVETQDDRVASVTTYTSNRPENACTAGNIGNGVWLSAAHCVTDATQSIKLTQFDGDEAWVKEWVYTTGNSDVLVLKTLSDISASAFDLPTQELSVGDVALVLGYGGRDDYSSIATFRVESLLEEGNLFSKVYRARSNGIHRTCAGDSGAPFYAGDTIYAIHSQGETNAGCTTKYNSIVEESRIFPRVSEINSIRAGWNTSKAAPSAQAESQGSSFSSSH